MNYAWKTSLPILMTLTVLLGVVVPEARAQQRLLPDFEVVALDGTTISSAELAPVGPWFVIYVIPGCRTCETLLDALARWNDPGVVAAALVVAGDAPEIVDAWLQERPVEGLEGLRVVADPGGSARRALHVKGLPTVVGIDRGTVRWALAGVLDDPKMVENVMRQWVMPRP